MFFIVVNLLKTCLKRVYNVLISYKLLTICKKKPCKNRVLTVETSVLIGLLTILSWKTYTNIAKFELLTVIIVTENTKTSGQDPANRKQNIKNEV